MKVHLEVQGFTSIVMETSSSMIRDLGVESRRQRRSGWYRRILGVIEQYKENVVENLIPLISENFSGSIYVKWRN